jgi:hypothetical protein
MGSAGLENSRCGAAQSETRLGRRADRLSPSLIGVLGAGPLEANRDQSNRTGLQSYSKGYVLPVSLPIACNNAVPRAKMGEAS